ncbi:hypothetical protein RB594_004749 [Gaeumannomyces avenae]
MTSNANRFSTYTTVSADSKDGEKKKDMWNSMLESVASGKRLPEKNLLVLGGTVDSQRDFLETLSNIESRRPFDRQGSRIHPPVANHFALGYTYYDVLDADQEDILARISFYSLTKPSHQFDSLVRPLLTPQSIPHTLIVVLLDWAEPWLWMRQLREWILLLRKVMLPLGDDAKEAMEDVMISWRDRGRGGGGTNLDGTGAAPLSGAEAGADVSLPLGPGEWEDALGLPLAVVCQNADKMELLEKMQGWKEENFDIVLQFMRTVLLKHGASLMYTSANLPSQLPTLIHSSLGITSLLKRQPLKHNVIDRDKIAVPPNWDSWGKIRVLRDGFDVESVSNGWSIDLDQPFPRPRPVQMDIKPGPVVNGTGEAGEEASADAEENNEDDQDSKDRIEGSTVTLYEDAVEDPTTAALQIAGRDSHSTRLEVETKDPQTFLAEQLKVLDQYRIEAEKESKGAEAGAAGATGSAALKAAGAGGRASPRPGGISPDPGAAPVALGAVGDHIGPVQFNMGGIQVDADDMVQRIKDRQAYGSSPEPTSPTHEEDEEAAGLKNHMDTDNLQAFFSGLMNRGKTRAAGA